MSGSRVQVARHTVGTVVVELSPDCAGSGRSSGIGGGVEVREIRRLVGVDLGIASAHTVRVLVEGGREVCRRRCEPTVGSLGRVEAAALAGTPVGTVLEVVMEPTGPAWLPVAVFFTARGHLVFRVSSAKAADLRRFLSRHAKSNGIDADTLARKRHLPLSDVQAARSGADPARTPRSCDRRGREAADWLAVRGRRGHRGPRGLPTGRPAGAVRHPVRAARLSASNDPTRFATELLANASAVEIG